MADERRAEEAVGGALLDCEGRFGLDGMLGCCWTNEMNEASIATLTGGWAGIGMAPIAGPLEALG